METVRDFVSEVNLPCDFLVERYGKLYRLYEESGGHANGYMFDKFYSTMISDKDEIAYKGVGDKNV